MPLTTSHIDDVFTSKEEGIQRLLSSILNLNLQHEVNEKHIVNIVNKLLSTAKHRKEGLEYLSIVIDNFSSSIIAENALNWTNHCITKFADDFLRELKLRVLGQIVQLSHNESDFNKRFVSDYILKVLDTCLTSSHINPYECKAAINTLTILMIYYPSSFGTHKQKIENFLLIFLDTENVDLVQHAASAFHNLQQVGSAGLNGANHRLNFTQSFHKLCRTIQKLYSVFFEYEKELFPMDHLNDEDVFGFQDDPSNSTQIQLHVNARRIRNILKFIEIMIKTKYPVAKETKPKELLEVITRGTTFHKCISGEDIESLETYHFSFLLSEIQCSALKLLRLFIIWYQTNCLPFSYTISKILVDCIERSHSCDCFIYNSLYLESSYRAVSDWLTLSKSSLHPQFQAQFLACMLKDITPVKTRITLTISEVSLGKKSQKAKRKAMAERIILSGKQTTSNEASTNYEKCIEHNTCKFALTALRHLLEFTKLTVKSTLIKDLYKSIFDSLTSVQSSKAVHPYTDAQCQAKLYEVLLAIYCQNTLTVLPPLHTSLDILSKGANDKNRFVAEICQKGLRNLEMLCQPVCPSLYLGAEIGEGMEELVRKVVEDDSVVDKDHNDTAPSVDFDASTDEYSPKSVRKGERRSTIADEDQQSSSYIYLDEKDSTNVLSQTSQYRLDTSTDTFVYENIENDTDVDGACEEGATNQDVEFEKIADDTQNEDEDQQDNIGTEPSFNDSIQELDQSVVFLAKRKEDNEEIVDTDVIQSDSTQHEIAFSNSREEQQEETVSSNIEVVSTEAPVMSPEFSGIESNRQDGADSTELYTESDEPPAKRAKTTLVDDEDMGDEFVEEAEKNKESDNNLDDDSFVDEVKDYY